MIETKHQTRFIYAECTELGTHKELGLDLKEVKEGDPLRQKCGGVRKLLSQLEKMRISTQRLYKALTQEDMPVRIRIWMKTLWMLS